MWTTDPVLPDCNHPLRLDSTDHRVDHGPAEERVLARKILEVPTAVWDPGDAHPRAELNVGALAMRLDRDLGSKYKHIGDANSGRDK